jgi:tetratricopeptide (TPR) repeat protein
MGAAGQVQATSGARVIEGRILEAEKKPENQNTPEYWKSRGEYYRGRKEYEKALEAFNKVLSMTAVPKTVEPPLGKGNGGEGQMRYWALGDVSRCLQELGKNREAFALFHQDLAQWPPDHQLAGHIANSLASDFNRDGDHLVQPGDKVLWTWLTARTDWSYGAERLLRTMSENAEPGEKNAFWDRLQTLALKDPEHSAIAGWVMSNQGEKNRAILCLTSALKGLPAGEKRESAAATLFGLYRDDSDWKIAALVLPEAARRYTYAEFAERYSDLAECAARSGYPKEAIKFWTRARDYDRWSNGSLKDLLRAGMKKELIEYYQNLIKKEPDCLVAKEQLELVKADRG